MRIASSTSLSGGRGENFPISEKYWLILRFDPNPDPGFFMVFANAF
jgi:hypothetical protein